MSVKGSWNKQTYKGFFDEACGFCLYSDTLQETTRPTMCAHFYSGRVCKRTHFTFSGMHCSLAINSVSFHMWLISLQPVIAANHNSDIRTDSLIYRGSGAQMLSPALSRSTERQQGGWWTWLAPTQKIHFYIEIIPKAQSYLSNWWQIDSRRVPHEETVVFYQHEVLKITRLRKTIQDGAITLLQNVSF